jgi:UPF0755 protein
MAKKKSARTSMRRIFKALIALFLILAIGGGIIGYKYYQFVFKNNVDLGEKETLYFYIPTGSGFDDVTELLESGNILRDTYSFTWLSEKKGYTTSVKSGRYLLKHNMTNNALIDLLRSGRQSPVQFTFNNIRLREQLAGRAGKLIEADSASICSLLYDENYLMEKYQLSAEEVMCIFIPNTYEFFWNTSAEQFVERMHREFSKFWNEDRKAKAEAMGLNPVQVTILASIVDQETKKADEVGRVAGVFVNRLKKGMLLQADPTVIFALGDFSINRVLRRHTEYDSPYNTYRYPGLPPGPICLPSPAVVDKTLDYERHDYIYFCAKEDFSGYHNFAKTLSQHNQNAARYQQALAQWLRQKK